MTTSHEPKMYPISLVALDYLCTFEASTQGPREVEHHRNQI